MYVAQTKRVYSCGALGPGERGAVGDASGHALSVRRPPASKQRHSKGAGRRTRTLAWSCGDRSPGDHWEEGGEWPWTMSHAAAASPPGERAHAAGWSAATEPVHGSDKSSSWGHLHSSVELGGESAKHATCVGLLTFTLKDGLQRRSLPLLGPAAPEEEGTRDVESICGHPPSLAMRIRSRSPTCTVCRSWGTV